MSAVVPLPAFKTPEDLAYPTSDGKPMAETDVHRDDMLDLIETLKAIYASNPWVYVSGNLLLFYERGNKRKHVSPDVFVVKGVRKHRRLHYLLWNEGKGPDVVIELTSKSTRKEDLTKKFKLYRDVLKVKEYFMFDPYGEYLKPSLQGFRLVDGDYAPTAPVAGRLPSKELGLHLERVGEELRLYDPASGKWLPSPREVRAAHKQESAARKRAEAEVQKLRRELEGLRRKKHGR